MKKYFGGVIFAFLVGFTSKAQGLLNKSETVFTHQDTLRGSITMERAWWNLKYYHLNVKVNPSEKSISGHSIDVIWDIMCLVIPTDFKKKSCFNMLEI